MEVREQIMENLVSHIKGISTFIIISCWEAIKEIFSPGVMCSNLLLVMIALAALRRMN